MRRGGLGATYRRENKKKRYTQKLTKKTKEEIKNRGGNTKSRPRTSYSTPGSRVGTTVHNESRDRVKAVIKSALKSNNKPVSKTRLNQSLGGRAGTTTERHKLKSYDSYKDNKGLSASESARKSEFKRATSYQGMRLGESRKDLASGFYSNKKSESERTKEKANVRKNIEKGYNKKAENSTASFLAGLTKSDKTIETASKALLDKKVDTSKVKKTGAYKAGDTVQELASYAIAPTEAAAEKIGAKVVEHTASKILQNSVKSLSRKEAKAMLKKAAAKDAIKEIGGKGIAKAATKTANKKAVSAATKGIKDKAVKDAIKEAGEKAIGSRVKRQLARRGGDVAANAALNAKYAVDRATDEKGRTNWGEAAKDFALNTGLDVGIGGSIDSVAGKIRKTKARNAEGVAKAESKIRENITKKANARASRAEARKLERETAKSEKTINIGTGKGQKKKSVKIEAPKRRHEQTTMYNAAEGKKTAVRGKKGARSSVQYDAGETVRGMQNRINKLEAEGKITSKEAKRRRNYLAKAYENITGRTGVVERSGQFSRITKKGLEDISNGKVGDKSLTFGSRFKGTAEKIGIEPKRLANKTYTAEVKKLAKAEQALDKQIANATGEQKSMLQRFKDKIDSRKDAPQSVSKGYESVENAEVKGTINNAENELKSPEISKERENLIERRNEIEQQVKDGKLDPEDAADDIGDIDERLDELETESTASKQGATEAKEPGGTQTGKRKEETPKTEPRKGIKKPSENPVTRKIQQEIGESKRKNGIAESNKAVIDARRKFVDSLYFTERQSKEWAENNGDKLAHEELRGSLNALRQANERANYSITKGQIDFNGKDVGESVKDIITDMNNKGTLEDAEAYLYLINHADRLDNAKSKEMGKLIEQYNKIEKAVENGKIESDLGEKKLATLEAKMDKLDEDNGVLGIRNNKRIFNDKTAKQARAEAEEIAKTNPEAIEDAQRIVKYFKNDLESQVQAGLVSREMADHFNEIYPNYVPAHRADFGDGVSKSLVPNIDALVAKGSGRTKLPIETQMQMSAHYTFEMGAQNEAKRIIARNSGANAEYLEALGKDPLEAAAYFEKGSGKIKFFEDGKLKTVDLGPEGKEIIKDLEDQIKNNVSEEWSKGAIHALGKVNKAFKALITDYSPVFMIKNTMRDIPEGAMQAESTRKYLAELIGANKGFEPALKSILTKDEWYNAYLKTGAGHSQLVNSAKLLSDKEFKLLKPLEKMQQLNEFAEQMPRLAEFKSALKRMGVTPETATKSQLDRASLAAADVTVNFGRSGSVGRIINKSFVPFFNPAIQGFDKIVRVINRDKTASGMLKLATKAALLGVAPVAVNEALVGDNPNYDKISDRDKMTNYYIPLDADNPILKVLDLEGKVYGSGKRGAKDSEMWLKLPKARILSVLGVIPQKVKGTLKDTDLGDVLLFAKDQVGPVSFLSNNIAAPISGALTNQTWYGSPIESNADQNEYKNGKAVEKAEHKRYDANTSAISIAIAKQLSKAGIEVSPKKMDYLLDSYTGIVGDIGLSMSRKSAQRGIFTKGFITDSTMQSDIQSRYYDKLTSSKTSDKDREKMTEWDDRISLVKKAIKGLEKSDAKDKAGKVAELTRIRNRLMQNAIDGKSNKSATSDMKAIAKVVGNKKAFDIVANDKDKEILKKYGKADDKFIDSYVAIKEMTKQDRTSKALAIASVKGGRKVAEAFGTTKKGTNDTKSAYARAKDYLKNGGSVEEYNALQKAIKANKDKGSDSYMTKAIVLAKAGASDRAYALYDIKDYKVRQARNMSALGIKQSDIAKAKSKADTDGSGRVNKAEAMAYINSMKGDNAKKSVVLEGIYWYARKYGNPYGSVDASAKQATNKKFKAKYGGGKSSDEGKAGPVPLKRGYQIENGKRKPNGKTIGSIGERVSLPAGRTASELKEAERKGEIKKVDVTERIHNAFGSRIGDTVKKKVYKATTIKDIKKNKDGSVDITFANGETWRNPVKKTPEDKTELSAGSDGGSGGGRRGYGRRGYRRYGRGGGGGSRSSGSASLEQNDIKLIGYGSTHIDSPKKIKAKGKVGLTKAQLRDIMKMAVILENSQKTKKQSTQDIYTIK